MYSTHAVDGKNTFMIPSSPDHKLQFGTDIAEAEIGLAKDDHENPPFVQNPHLSTLTQSVYERTIKLESSNVELESLVYAVCMITGYVLVLILTYCFIRYKRKRACFTRRCRTYWIASMFRTHAATLQIGPNAF